VGETGGLRDPAPLQLTTAAGRPSASLWRSQLNVGTLGYMTEDVLLLFFSLFALAMLWLVLVSVLFRTLAKKHPAMHQRIGSPRGFEPQATVALFSFLLTRKPESLGDSAVLRQANIMRALLATYLAGFTVLLYSIVSGHNGA
jgi:hypothetical protein